MMDLGEYRASVDALMKRDYGLDWQMACGDTEPLVAAIERGDAPEAFVRRFARKYDLKRLDDAGIYDCDRCGTRGRVAYSDPRTGNVLCERCAAPLLQSGDILCAINVPPMVIIGGL